VSTPHWASRWASPRFWLLTLAAVSAATLTASLGFWQLDRAAQKEAMQARIDMQRRRPALGGEALAALAAAPAGVAPELQRPVALRGRWLAQHTVYLDNRQMHGQPGFYVVTPLAVDGTAQTVLVQRGWVPRNFVDRTRLPPVETPNATVEIAGRLAAAPSRLFELGGKDGPGGPGASIIRQNLDLAAFAAETRLSLAPYTVLQTGPASEGLVRDWPEADAGTGKHYGYAFQWFGLCGLVAILYVWFQFIAPRRRRQDGAPHG